MPQASFSTTGLSVPQANFERQAQRRSLSTWLLEALHCSRLRQAERVLRQFAHLIAESDQRAISNTPDLKGPDNVDE